MSIMHTDFLQGFRLSPQQRRIWLLQQDSQVYRAQCAIQLKGDVQPELLKQALVSVIDRHEILRTTFNYQPGIRIPVQVIMESLHPLWSVINLDGLDPEMQKESVEELLRDEAGRPFDFKQGPLVRSVLVTLSRREALILLTMPSLCADAFT